MTSDFKCAAFTAELVFASALFCFVFFIYCGVSVQLHRENELVNLHPHHVCCRQHIIGISFSKSVHIHVRRRGSTRAHPQRQWSAGCNEAALSFTHTHRFSFLAAVFWCFRLSPSLCMVQRAFVWCHTCINPEPWPLWIFLCLLFICCG